MTHASGCQCLSPLRSKEFLFLAYQYVVIPDELYTMDSRYLPRYPEATGLPNIKLSVK